MKSLIQVSKVMHLTLSHSNAVKRIHRAHEKVSSEPFPAHQNHEQMRTWANEVLSLIRITKKVSGDPLLTKPGLYVGNHISYVDIPLLMSEAPIVFIAKKQIASWPVFGRACNLVRTVFVDRDSTESRKNATQHVGKHIKEYQQSVCIFPSGTTSATEEKPWRWGAFQISKEFQVPIKPFRLRYQPLEKVLFVGEQLFIPHLLHLVVQKDVRAELEFGESFVCQDVEKDALKWWQWSREGLAQG